MVAGPKRTSRAPKKQSPPQLTIDQRSFELVFESPTELSRNEADNVTSAINRAIHQQGISSTRVESVRYTDTGRLLGTTTYASSLQDLLGHRDTVLRAAHPADSSIRDIVT